ncbi:gasdermin-D isoform X1 [Camelus dromedarius]|uniref:gasdermin-D isoform X1 n=1 Tax=Camelus dromedarius TaxID=9838 RepID=UPI003119B02F
MASAFERVVKSVVQELDHSQELTPVNSLWSSAGFQPYCLLGRRPSSSWFWRPRYKCVSLSLRDILEPDAPEPAVEQDSPFHFHETMDGQLKGSVKLAVPGQGKISGKAAGSSSSSASVNVCMLRVAPSTWEAMRRERRLRKPEHKILQQLRHRGDDVFVVTEVLQMQKEVEITQTHKQEGSGQFALPGAICLQGKGQGHMSRKKTVTIPSGTILAFRVAQLIIDPDWDILLFPNKKQRTFSGPLQAGRTGPGSQPEPSLRVSDQLKFLSDGLMEDQLETTEDFQGLQLEVGAWAAGLEGLSEEPCGQLLGGLGQVLQDEHALEALEELLERGLCGGQVEPQDGPVGAILECLVLPSRQLEEELAGPVSYLLGALAGAEPFGAEFPVAGAQGCVPATRAPGEQLGRRGTLLGPARGVRPSATGRRPPGVLGAGSPMLHICTVRLPRPAVEAEPALLAGLPVCPLVGTAVLAGQVSCPPSSQEPNPAMWVAHHKAWELGKVNKCVEQRKDGSLSF